jgi:hypothetical protein
MGVGGDLGEGECVDLLAADLALDEPVAEVQGRVPLQVRQGEGHGTVAAVSGPEQRKQSLFLIDGQELSVAKGPAFRREIETEDSDFT